MISSAIAIVAVSVACAGVEPAVAQLAAATPTADSAQAWAVVDLPKPTATPGMAFPPPTATTVDVTSESPTPEAPPWISMVIVSDEGPPAASEGQAPEATNTTGKSVHVSIGEQHLYAYENGQLVFSFVASTGMRNSTRVGTFQVLDKIPNAYGSNWDIWMPNWLGIYWSGGLENGIHALPILPSGNRLWAGYLGRPISYGCVVLGVDEAAQLYDWIDVGTPVEIRR